MSSRFTGRSQRCPGCVRPGTTNIHGRPGGSFPQRELAPMLLLSKMPAVVGPQHDDCVVLIGAGVESIQQPPNLRIEKLKMRWRRDNPAQHASIDCEPVPWSDLCPAWQLSVLPPVRHRDPSPTPSEAECPPAETGRSISAGHTMADAAERSHRRGRTACRDLAEADPSPTRPPCDRSSDDRQPEGAPSRNAQYVQYRSAVFQPVRDPQVVASPLMGNRRPRKPDRGYRP